MKDTRTHCGRRLLLLLLLLAQLAFAFHQAEHRASLAPMAHGNCLACHVADGALPAPDAVDIPLPPAHGLRFALPCPAPITPGLGVVAFQARAPPLTSPV